jgi:UDP-N-acetylglucosamine 1-carboxyvinyltransferase
MRIVGRQQIKGGSLLTSGAKNSALPIAFASLLVHGTSTISNIPSTLLDLGSVLRTLRHFGIGISTSGNSISLSNTSIAQADIPESLFTETRYSFLLLSILLRLFGRAKVYAPGGCSFGGERPIDIYLDGLCAFGAKIRQCDGVFFAELEREAPTEYALRYPSVGATEALVLFAVLAPGCRVLRNCACEPEVGDLIGFLTRAGASIDGVGTSTLTVHGVNELYGTNWSLIPDRIEIGTYALYSAALKFDIEISPVLFGHIDALLAALSAMGVPFECRRDTATLCVFGSSVEFLKPLDIATSSFPGFPTDLQPLFAAASLSARGSSRVTDNVFPERFAYVRELKKLGAGIVRAGNTAMVSYSVPHLAGTDLICRDIRCGAACVLAALCASGESRLHNSEQIERGYDRFLTKLSYLGIAYDR